MQKLYGIINSDTGVIFGISRPEEDGGPVDKPKYTGLNPNMIEVELLEDDRGNVTYEGEIPALVKEHNWQRVKGDRDLEVTQDITVDGLELHVDPKSFEAMKDLVSILGNGDSVKWKLKSGKRELVTKEQLKEAIQEYIENRQDNYEASWEVEDDLSNGSTYSEAKIKFREKASTRKKNRKKKFKK